MNGVEPPGRPDTDHVLTRQRRAILQFIRSFGQRHGYPPTLREIGAAAGLVPSTVSYHRSILEKHGYLSHSAGLPRTAVEPPPGYPAIRPGADEVEVPLVGRIAAGLPALIGELAEGTYLLPRQLVGGGTLFMLTVAGDSMIGASIADGDLVVVRQQPTAENGEIVAAMVGNGAEAEATVKTLQRANGHLWLKPHNPDYAPIPGDDATILGKGGCRAPPGLTEPVTLMARTRHALTAAALGLAAAGLSGTALTEEEKHLPAYWWRMGRSRPERGRPLLPIPS
jgi:repressor LexA